MFYLGSLIMYALGGDIAYGILHMDNVVGLHGWQWLFMIEGAITVCAGIVFVVFFPSSPAHPVSVVGIRYFDERESQILVQRVCRDDPTKRPRARNITMAEVKSTVTNWRLIPHVLMALCGLSPLSAFGAYGPTLIASWGYDLLESNAWMSIGPWCAVVVSICLGFTADKTGLRGPWVLFGGFFWWLFLLVTRIILFNPNGHIRFAVLTAAFSFALVWHPINASWMALNARSPGERSITMAVYIMSANASGIMGSQFFQASDGPIYEHAFTTILALVSLALVAMVFANLQYFLLNRRANKKGSEIRYQQ